MAPNNGRQSAQVLFKVTMGNRKIFHSSLIIAPDKIYIYIYIYMYIPPLANSAVIVVVTSVHVNGCFESKEKPPECLRIRRKLV